MNQRITPETLCSWLFLHFLARSRTVFHGVWQGFVPKLVPIKDSEWPRRVIIVSLGDGRKHEKNSRLTNKGFSIRVHDEPQQDNVFSLVSLLESYLNNLAVKGFALSTLRVRRVHIQMFLAWCDRTRVTELIQVTSTSVGNYQRYLFDYRKKNGLPLAIASQHARLAQLKLWFKWMARRNYISDDPTSELELPRVGYKLPCVLNIDETELVLEQPNLRKALGIRDRAILEILYSTGIRRGEVLRLKIYDIDAKYGLATIREGKGKRDRVVPVGERALFWLERYLTEVRPRIVRSAHQSVIFLTAVGQSFTPNHLSWLVRRYVIAAALGKTGACHIFRHTMATLMLEGGADIRYIQAMLGHVRLDTTKIYTHVSIRMLKQIHNATHPAASLDSLRLRIEPAEQSGNESNPKL